MNERFYPPEIKPFRFEPGRDKFEIVVEGSKGEGVVSRAPFKKGNVVFAFRGEEIGYQTLYTLQIEEGRYLNDPYFMGKVLHSCSPNMRCDMRSLKFYALRNIGPGEYLTMDYESTEAVLFRNFQCSCGSLACRGWISGYASRREVLPLFVQDAATTVSASA